MHRQLILLILGATLAGACAGTTYTASATFSAPSPDLVLVRPGVYAVANFSDPVFFANNFYWRYDDGLWFRSRSYTGGWQFVARPPTAIVRLDRPYARYYRDRDRRVHVDYRWRPSDDRRPREIREYRSRRVDRDRPRVVVPPRPVRQ